MKMKPLIDLGYVSVGMVITDVNGLNVTIEEIIVPSSGEHVKKATLPKNSDLVLKLDCGQYLHTDIGWDKLDRRILVVSEEESD